MYDFPTSVEEVLAATEEAAVEPIPYGQLHMPKDEASTKDDLMVSLSVLLNDNEPQQLETSATSEYPSAKEGEVADPGPMLQPLPATEAPMLTVQDYESIVNRSFPQYLCKKPNCFNAAIKNELCRVHYRSCLEPGCTKKKKYKGYCREHVMGRGLIPPCKIEGCSRLTLAGGLCQIHYVQCRAPNCPRKGAYGGYCAEHGEPQQCLVLGCRNRGRQRGLCQRHSSAKHRPQLMTVFPRGSHQFHQY